MSATEMWITIGLACAATLLTRVLPYVLLFSGDTTPAYIKYLGKTLAPAVFGLLVVYCLRNVSASSAGHGAYEATALLAIGISYARRKNLILSMLLGTVCYMVLLRLGA